MKTYNCVCPLCGKTWTETFQFISTGSAMICGKSYLTTTCTQEHARGMRGVWPNKPGVEIARKRLAVEETPPCDEPEYVARECC